MIHQKNKNKQSRIIKHKTIELFDDLINEKIYNHRHKKNKTHYYAEEEEK